MRYVPAGVFICGLAAAVYLWSVTIVGPTVVGEVEAPQALATAGRAGVVTNLLVTPFQIVKKGDPVAEIIVTDARFISSQVADLRSKIAQSQLEINSIIGRERLSFDFQALSIATMRNRADLAAARAELPTVEAALKRNEEAFKEKVLAYNEYELSLRLRDSTKARIEELERLVTESESRLKMVEPASGLTNTGGALREALRKLEFERQEAVTSLAEHEILRAPIDGIIGKILKRDGENVAAGEPVLTIHGMEADRIVAYLRQGTPLPTKGAQVRVRCRSIAREEAMAKVEEIGFRYEPITNQALLRPGLFFETGMPIGVTMPPALKSILRPGELVDLALDP